MVEPKKLVIIVDAKGGSYNSTEMVNGNPLDQGAGPYIDPKAKMPMIEYLCFLSVCRFWTNGTGSIKIVRSRTKSNIVMVSLKAE